jgi:hypothetical protein
MFLTHATYFYLGLPFISLFGWNGILWWDYFYEKTAHILPTISVLCVTVALFCWAWSFVILIWDNFQTNFKSTLFMVLGNILFVGYIGIQIFGYQLKEIFLPYTSFFFFINFQFVSAGSFLVVY